MIVLGVTASAARADPMAPETAPDDPPTGEALREMLTEREDELRAPDPWTTRFFGHPLTLNGQYEIGLDGLRRPGIRDPLAEGDRLLFEQELEFEAFYTLGAPLSVFVQLRLKMENDLAKGTDDRISDEFVERGEMWLHSEDLFGSLVDVELGSLDFEDDRTAWWDEDLDAIRLGWETESWELTLAAARELGPRRSDRDDVSADHERVLRWIAELSWDWQPDHTLQVFGLYHDDRSPRERVGETLRTEREDDSDARIGWLGARLLGAWAPTRRGLLGYWLEAGAVHGNERVAEYSAITRRTSVVDGVTRRDVRGAAVDVGVTWIAPIRHAPRVTVAYAWGSGDRRPDAGTDRGYRQTGLHSNEAAFGGVERFQRFGEILDPELSNLSIVTLGAGISLFESSSLDLVYHGYRLVEPTTELRDARLDPELTGRHHDLGHGLDLILAIEEWKHVQVEVSGSVFRTGSAFGDDRDAWLYGGSLLLRVAF